MKWYSLLFSFIFCILFFSSVNHAEAKEMGLFINDKPISTDSVPPFIKNGTTMVPLRAITESFSLQVNWDSATRSIHLSRNDIDIKLIIDETLVEVNGEKMNLPVAPLIVKDRTFVPLRFIGEQLKKSVEWEPEQGNIFISDNKRESDLFWLSKLVEAEAEDEPYQGKVAVAAVVVNRTQSPFFPKSIKSVIFEKKQFTPVQTRRIYSMNPVSETIKATSEAMDGFDPSKGALYFFNPQKTKNQFLVSRSMLMNIGNHRFTK